MLVAWSDPIRVDFLRGGLAVTVKPVVYHFQGLGPLLTGKPRDWKLVHVVPKGVVFDGASVPRLLQSAAPGRFHTVAAALIHDHGHENAYALQWTQEFVDHLFLKVLLTEGRGSQVSGMDARKMWAAVASPFGTLAWKRNREEERERLLKSRALALQREATVERAAAYLGV